MHASMLLFQSTNEKTTITHEIESIVYVCHCYKFISTLNVLCWLLSQVKESYYQYTKCTNRFDTWKFV